MRPFICLLSVVLVFTIPAGATLPDPLAQGVAAYRAGAPGHALIAFTEAASMDPQNALPALWAGVAAVATGRPQEAVGWFQRAMTRRHNDAEAQIAYAWIDRLTALSAPIRVAGSTWLTIAGLAREQSAAHRRSSTMAGASGCRRGATGRVGPVAPGVRRVHREPIQSHEYQRRRRDGVGPINAWDSGRSWGRSP